MIQNSTTSPWVVGCLILSAIVIFLLVALIESVIDVRKCNDKYEKLRRHHRSTMFKYYSAETSCDLCNNRDSCFHQVEGKTYLCCPFWQNNQKPTKKKI